MERNIHMHLMITEECNHDCKYCCNKQYDIKEIPLPTKEEWKSTEVLFLTGGEPFLRSDINYLAGVIKECVGIPKIVVYTSGEVLKQYLDSHGTLSNIDGLNICPKTTDEFYDVREILLNSKENGISSLKMNRLYLFPRFYKMYEKGLMQAPENFEIHKRVWQKEFEPGGGIFRKLSFRL